MGIPTINLNDGNTIPLLSFGTGTAWYKDGGKGPLSQPLIDMVKEAISLGIYHIDVADAYGTEEEVGIAIKECGVPREQLFITTKVQDNVKNIPEAIDASLKKLDLEYVDLYLIHNPFFAKSDDDLQVAWSAMEQVKASGKAKSIGVSNFLRPHLEAVLKTAKSVPVINQIEYQPYLQRANDLVPWMRGQSINAESFKPLAPLIGGKGGPLDEPLVRIANAHSASPNAVLLRWQMQQGIVVITTTKTPSRLKEYLKAVEFTLTGEEMQEITKIGASHHYRAGYRKRFDENDRT